MYGPLVLAGKLGAAGLTTETLRAEPTKPRTVPEYKAEPVAAPTIRAASADPSTWLKPAGALEFRTVGQPKELDARAAEPDLRRALRRLLEDFRMTL